MKISVIGLGYIGLPTAAILAKHQVTVSGVDIDNNVVNVINNGKVHIIEPELESLVHSAVENGFLHAHAEPQVSDVFMIAVPTPIKKDFKPDLSYVESAVKMIAPVIKKGNLVILESTSPVGTTEKIAEWMREIRSDLSFPKFRENSDNHDVFIAHCPERVLPGNVIKEIVLNDRIIGGMTDTCAKHAAEIYEIFVKGVCIETDCRTAELSKLVENSYRDLNIAFANELSLICDELDINVWDLIKQANLHPRVNILQPGPGVGGHCIAVDPWFIVNSSPKNAKLIKQARLVNDSKPKFIITKINEAISKTGKEISELKIACLGLAFKPNIDDLRESPALKIAKELDQMGFDMLYLVEPNISDLGNIFNSKNTELVELDIALKQSDVIVLLVDHDPFKVVNIEQLSNKKIIDTRGIWT